MLKKIIMAGMFGAFVAGCPVEESAQIKSTPVNLTETSAHIERYKDGFKKTLDSPFGKLSGTSYDSGPTYISVTRNESITMLVERDNDDVVDEVSTKSYLRDLDDRNKEPELFERADQILKYWKEH